MSNSKYRTLPFPATQPPGYVWLDDEPPFDPDRHLALEQPTEVVMLADLGYEADEIATKVTPVAISAPFRLLSDEGARVMLDVARKLESFVRPAGDRIERMTRAGCYRSRWLRDLCISEDVAGHLSGIYGVEIAPHPMTTHLGHLNYAPRRVEAAVDKWHHDTIPLDYVLPVTDMTKTPGGRFEYFLGTRHEAAELQEAGRTPPRDRVVEPEFPGPGYAVALHGDMVVHRGAPLTELSERITMVNGYVTVAPPAESQSRTVDLIGVDDPAILYPEWARTAAWRSAQRLRQLVDELDFADDVDHVVGALGSAIADVELAMAEMTSEQRRAEHYE